MTNHSRYAFVLALLAGVGFLEVETAHAERPGVNFSNIAPSAAATRIPKVKPIVRPNVVKIAPRPRLDVPNLTPKLPRTYQVDLAKLKASAKKRGRSPSYANTPTELPNVAAVVRRPKLKSPKLGRRIPAGNLATQRNILPNPSGVKQNGPAAGAGAQQHPSVPQPAAPPVDDNLADAITVTGGSSDWWKAFEQWSDIATAGPGNFQPEFVPGGGRHEPEIDLTPFGPDRPGESGEGQGGIGPRGWPGAAQGNSPFGDPSGQVSQDWVPLWNGGGRIDTNGDGVDDATYKWVESSDGQGNSDTQSTTSHDDGRSEDTLVSHDAEGNVDVVTSYYANGDGTGKTVHTRNGIRVNYVPWLDPIVITAGEDTGEDEGDEKESGNPEGSQPGAEGTGRPRGGAREVDCDWWGCVDGGVSTPARTNPGHADNQGSLPVGGSIGTGAVTDPTPMDDTTGSSGGGYHDPAPGGNPGDPDGPGTP
jgi:hypothetical protein